MNEMCECQKNDILRPMTLGALRGTAEIAPGEPAPVSPPEKLTFDDLWQLVGLFQVVKFISEL